MRIERRLRQPRWLMVAVPAGSLVFAFFASGLVLLATGHDALSSYRQIVDAAFLNSGALGQTLTQATPLAFTGLADTPFLAAASTRLVGTTGEAGPIGDVAAAAVAGIEPNEDIHASAEYRRHLAEIAARRALVKAVAGAR